MKNKKIYLIVDIIIILILIGVIFVYYKITKSGEAKTCNDTITYRVEVSSVDMDYINTINIGDILYSDLNGESFGKIVDIEYVDSYIYLFNEISHTYSKEKVNDKYDLYIDIENCVYDNGINLLIGDYDVKIGKEMDLYTDRYSLYGFIVDIEGEDNEDNKE